MKKKNWYRSLSLADDKYVEEARPDRVIKPKRSKALAFIAACACFALLIGNLWLFIPFRNTPPDVSQYADSAYYGIIQKLNVLTYTPPKYKNNAAKLWARVKSLFPGMDGSVNSGGSAGTDGDRVNAYREITDNQVAGVIEADRIKRSDTHIYYLDRNVLRVYAIDKENTKEVGSYTLFGGSLAEQWEFYLSSDAKTVTVVTHYYEAVKGTKSVRRCVKIVSLDVSDPENIVKKEEFTINGEYISSRMADGDILLLTEYVVNKSIVDFGDETTFLPQIDEGEGPYSIPACDVIAPETLDSSCYTVVMKLDGETLAVEGSAAYLSYSEDVYVSEDHVFLTHAFTEEKKNGDGTVTRSRMTEIACLSYGGDSFDVKGSVTVRGYVKDQWSMDEHKGILRVFTTTSATTVKEKPFGNPSSVSEPTNASLYCVDLSTFEVVASVIDFAPPHEVIRSVRFDGESAYVCTSIQLSDPVFFFDLSDLGNITYKDTGTIEGFSTSLINLGNGYLLGIGRGGDWHDFKVEVYEETETGIRAVSSYELRGTKYSTEYKSYYVDRQNQLIGMGVNDYFTSDYVGERERYILLHFDGYELSELVNVPLAGDLAVKRGVYIDGYLYMFGREEYKVAKVFGE